jgi:pimeloyl-ACP methyl ester carboxylesterase
VLVHGIGGYSASWLEQYAALKDRFRVIAWDAPGYGGSELRSPAPRADDYARALLALLDHLNVGSVCFVGHSLGAVFVAALCRLRPNLAQRVIFLHPVTGSGKLSDAEREPIRAARINDLNSLGSRGFAEKRGRAIIGSSASPAAVAQAIAVMSSVPEAGYLAAWDAMCAADIFADLAYVRTPVLILCGSEDPVSPPATNEAIAGQLPQAELKIVPKLGHYGTLEMPELVNTSIRQFCSA